MLGRGETQLLSNRRLGCEVQEVHRAVFVGSATLPQPPGCEPKPEGPVQPGEGARSN